MIGFHEVRFPEDVSWGSSGGPVYKTQVFTSHRGYEKRNVDWSQPMMKFNAANGVKTDAQILGIIDFFNARQGMLFGFRYKNWCNYQIINAPIATGDGASYRLPMWKFYGFPGARHYKRLRKIVRGSVTGVQLGHLPVVEGVDFRIDYDSGEIVTNLPVGYGIPVRAATLEFDEPVRFDEDSIENVIAQFNNNNLNKLDLISIRGDFSAGSAFSPNLADTGTPDAQYGRTYLLLNFDGVNGDTASTDQSVLRNSLTFHNSAKIATDSFRHGNASAFFGPNGYISTGGSPYQFSGLSFTVEGFAQRPLEGELLQPIVALWDETTDDRSWMLRYNMTNRRIEFLASATGTDSRVVLSHPWETATGHYDHFSVDHLSSGWYVLRINGKVKQTTRDRVAIARTNVPLTVGRVAWPQGTEGSFQGRLDSLRITHGVSRYEGFLDVDIPVPYSVA
jgi:uncharacterized protein (TIGR02217 family)